MVRVSAEPGFVLHGRDYQDDSLLLELFTPGHGRLGAVAKGARRSRRGRRALLQPFRPLSLSWSRRGELASLSGVEAAGPAPDLAGETVFSGFYLNELLLSGLRRDDAMPEVFDLYAASLQALDGSGTDTDGHAAVLRRFEIGFLGLLGYGLDLEHEAGSDRPLDEAARYRIDPGLGPVPAGVRESVRGTYAGSSLLELARGRFSSQGSLHDAREVTRILIEAHLGPSGARTRELIRDLRRLRVDRMRP